MKLKFALHNDIFRNILCAEIQQYFQLINVTVLLCDRICVNKKFLCNKLTGLRTAFNLCVFRIHRIRSHMQIRQRERACSLNGKHLTTMRDL